MASQLEKYRKDQQFLYNFRSKYSKLIELNDEKRKKWNFTNFFKKRLFYDTVNVIDDDVDGIFRFRCNAYEINEELDIKIKSILDIYNEQLHIINLEDDKDMKVILTTSLEQEIEYQILSIICSADTKKCYIIFDMRLYESCSRRPIIIDGNKYYLDVVQIY